jgi:hypothetical protein
MRTELEVKSVKYVGWVVLEMVLTAGNVDGTVCYFSSL